ncbi:MAG: DUF72 domain-containing protein [Alphaproteobacteria bacterium]|nr:DUF72 domain-containing protein [Alphaproteobacteria bacterium]MBV9421221.1 DUF72 domain-containing protein [Alphaproteobacteria bacterium]
MIRAGIGGWNFEPWRGVFFPEGTSKAKELQYASRQVTTIEVNGTFYSTFKPPTFQKWYAETPDDFVFSLKANRFCTNRRVLAEAKQSIDRFLDSGVTELKSKLGPILWQFMHTKKFDPADFEAFLALLPKEHKGVPLRHAVEPRHESFKTPEFIAMAREYGAAIVFADAKKFPTIPDPTADFVYCRLQETQEKVVTGYTTAELKKWGEAAKAWEAGGLPKGMDPIGKAAPKKKRDVFVYFIAGAKVRNPAAAVEFLKVVKK